MPPNSFLCASTSISILFGDCDSPYTLSLHEPITPRHYQTLCDAIPCTNLILLNQVHSTVGHHITAATLQSYTPRSLLGDYSITTLPHIALGVITADCIPLFLYDPVKRVIAALHAGWRGSIAHIVPRALEDLCRVYQSSPHTIHAWIGPSARSCCYEIKEPLITQLQSDIYATTGVVRTASSRSYADFTRFISHQLHTHGILPEAITIDTTCTICCPRFFSYRRNPAQQMRQISCIALR
jgi:YfiH family protein